VFILIFQKKIHLRFLGVCQVMKEEEMKVWIDIIDKDNNYEKSIQITENAQVMLLKNIVKN
jgi:hypothetical protein